MKSATQFHINLFFFRKFGTLDNTVKEEAWRTAVLGIEQHTETLARIFSSERLDSQDKLAHLNALQVFQTHRKAD